MTLKTEKIKDITASIQSVAVAVGIIIGGVWAVYTFIVLATRERAAQESAKLQDELQARAILSLQLTIDQPSWPETPAHLVQVSISATNNGNRLEVLRFDRPPIHVSRFEPGQGGGSALKGPLNVPQLESPLAFEFRTMSPKETYISPPILITLSASGVYLFEVCVPIERVNELESSKKVKGLEGLNVCVSKYFFVK